MHAKRFKRVKSFLGRIVIRTMLDARGIAIRTLFLERSLKAFCIFYRLVDGVLIFHRRAIIRARAFASGVSGRFELEKPNRKKESSSFEFRTAGSQSQQNKRKSSREKIYRKRNHYSQFHSVCNFHFHNSSLKLRN